MKYLLILGFIFTNLSAELSPQIYQEWKAKAKEVLEIKVLDIKTHTKKSVKYIYATAKVVKIFRSKSHLKRGSIITIYYTKRAKQTPLILGASEPITLKKSYIYKAYLKKERLYLYTIAAGGKSFKQLN
jgi:hypothetical protein